MENNNYKMKCPRCGGNKLNLNSMTNMWICSECGEQFRDLDAFKREIDNTGSRVKFFVGLSVFLIIAGIFIYKLGEMTGESFMSVLGIIAFPTAAFYLYLAWKVYSTKDEKQAEYERLVKKVRGE